MENNTIKQVVSELLVKAMKEKNTITIETLRSLKTSFTILEKENKELAESDYIGAIRKAIKQREHSAKLYLEASRQDLHDKEITEISILETLLPKELSESEAENLLIDTADKLGLEVSKQNMGKLVKATVEASEGKTNGKIVSGIIQRILNEK